MPFRLIRRKIGCFFKILFLGILAIGLGISFIWAPQIDHALGLRGVDYGDFQGEYSASDVIEIGDENARMIIHFVDVGQADAQLILTPSGQRIIIDAGTGIGPSAGWLMEYIYEHFDSEYMRSRPFGFDYAILTHAHEDHMGEFPDVLERYGSSVFYRPNVLATRSGFIDPGVNMLRRDNLGRLAEQNTLIYSRVIERVHNTSLVPQDGVRVVSGDMPMYQRRITPKPESGIYEGHPNFYELFFYTPTRNFYSNHNDFSPIKILYFQGRRIVLTGDAERIGEQDFVDTMRQRAEAGIDSARYGKFLDSNFTVDVIALGHHGSRTSSHDFFLEFLTTDESRPHVLTVISTGQNNRHGHPHSQVLNRLDEMGFNEDNILRTDVHGTIVMTIYEGELFVGGTVHRTEGASISAALTWIPLSITLWFIIAFTILILPGIMRRKRRRERRNNRRNINNRSRNNSNRNSNWRR
ncbi:MAG: MBL fold metallo-hydrolase [Firmicutes bacterium]|nr:MBL fold metallo-hydrolase [Bacillota bacterium]